MGFKLVSDSVEQSSGTFCISKNKRVWPHGFAVDWHVPQAGAVSIRSGKDVSKGVISKGVNCCVLRG